MNRGTLKYTIDKSNQGHTGFITCLSLINNEMFASGSNDTSVKIWNASTGALKHTFARSSTDGIIGNMLVTSIVSTKLGNGGNFVVTNGAGDGSIKVWDLKTGKTSFAWDHSNGGHNEYYSFFSPFI